MNIRFLVAYGAVAAFSLFLRSELPVTYHASAAGDDALFAGQAIQLLTTGWLGPYSSQTLVKGPGFPMMLAISMASGISAISFQHLFHLASAFVFSRVLFRILDDERAAFIGFVVLALNPILFAAVTSRIIREGFYTGLTMLFAGTLALIMLGLEKRRRAAAIGAGLCGGWLAITREEGIWLWPVIASALALAWFGRHTWRSLALSVAVASAAAAVPVIAVVAANHAAYGVATVTEIQGTGYPRAFAALTRVEHDRWTRFSAFPRDARERVAGVSPAFREISEAFERRYGVYQAEVCGVFGCSDLPAGWLPWVLREAVAENGHHADATRADAFYRRLADEIDAACDEARLPCGSRRTGISLPFRPHYVMDTLAELPLGFRNILLWDEAGFRASPSEGERLDFWASLLGPLQPAGPVEAAEGRGAEALALFSQFVRAFYGPAVLLGWVAGLVGCCVVAAGRSTGRTADRAARDLGVVFVLFSGIAVIRIGVIAYTAVSVTHVHMAANYLLPANPPTVAAAAVGWMLVARLIWRRGGPVAAAS